MQGRKEGRKVKENKIKGMEKEEGKWVIYSLAQ